MTQTQDQFDRLSDIHFIEIILNRTESIEVTIQFRLCFDDRITFSVCDENFPEAQAAAQEIKTQVREYIGRNRDEISRECHQIAMQP